MSSLVPQECKSISFELGLAEGFVETIDFRKPMTKADNFGQQNWPLSLRSLIIKSRFRCRTRVIKSSVLLSLMMSCFAM